MKPYLASTTCIDWKHPAVQDKARQLALGIDGDKDIARRCFEFVRDEISHSWDARQNPVTCTASQVLEHGTGYCYAKSHLLAALLRANGIPAGLCYQRVTITDEPPYCLHGLNAIYLQEYGWYRVDPRGNKKGVNALFLPPHEKLAFSTVGKGEADLPEIWAEPLPQIVRLLESATTFQEVADNLPDVALVSQLAEAASKQPLPPPIDARLRKKSLARLKIGKWVRGGLQRLHLLPPAMEMVSNNPFQWRLYRKGDVYFFEADCRYGGVAKITLDEDQVRSYQQFGEAYLEQLRRELDVPFPCE